MFTIDQIQQAHTKVKSGSDFPSYIQELKEVGVESYTSYVKDGHTIFVNSIGHSVTTPSKYSELTISDALETEEFLKDLRAHQEGKTDYLQFCRDCAKSGVEKWRVDLVNLTCIYFDKEDNVVLVEQIPA